MKVTSLSTVLRFLMALVAVVCWSAAGCGSSGSDTADAASQTDLAQQTDHQEDPDVPVQPSDIHATDDMSTDLPTDPDLAGLDERSLADEEDNPEDVAVPQDLSTPEVGWVEPEPCDSLGNKDCVEIRRGEKVFYRHVSDYDVTDYDDKGTVRTVIRLYDLVDEHVAAEPEKWRYQLFGTDGFTFGGFANWDQMLQGYMEVGSRRVVWEPILELPESWRVKDTYRIEMSPAGE
jgi:hypothetical protein